MSRARQVANFDPALLAADEVSGDKVHGGTISGSPVLVTPNIGTPSAGVVTNLSGVLPVGVTGGSGLSSRDRNENLFVIHTGTATVDIDADFLTVFDTNNVGRILSSVNLTCNISTGTGINTLDTGAEGSSRWYHLWVIYNGTTTASLVSESVSAPTMPSGYTFKKYVGAVRNASDSNFVNFDQGGNSVCTKNEQVHSDTSTGAWDTVTLVNHIPPNATAVIGNVYTNGTGENSGYSYLSSNIDGGDVADGMGQQYTRVYSSGQSGGSVWTPFKMPITTASTIFSYNESTSNVVKVCGWEYQGIV